MGRDPQRGSFGGHDPQEAKRKKMWANRAGGEVAVELAAVGDDAVPLHGERRRRLAGGGVAHGAHAVVDERRVGDVVADVAAEADGGDRQRHDLGHEAVLPVGTRRVHRCRNNHEEHRNTR